MVKLMVVTPYFYPKIGGMEKHVFTLYKGLKEKYGYNIVVITSNHEKREFKEEIIEGIRIYRLPIQFKISNTPISFKWKKEISRIVDIEKPDIINGRGPVPYISDISSIVAKEKNIPFFLGWHFPSMNKNNIFTDLIINIYEKYIMEKMLKNSKIIICTSNFVKNTLLKKHKKKTIVITQGIDNNIFYPSKKLIANKSILFVGNYETKIKGLDYLIYGFSKVLSKNKDLKLKIVGSGNDNYYKKLCRKLRINNNVEFLGKLYGVKLADEYRNSLIFVLPSTVDNLPSTIIEAMFCKTPVIATKVGDIPQWINKNTGLLINKKNSNEIKNNILKLLNNKNLCKNLTSNAYKLVENEFYWNDKIEKTNKIIKNILK